jgi:DNA polymerase-1
MRQYKRTVAGEPVVINVVQEEADLDGFREFIRNNLRILGCDSETTGLDIYNDGFRCRLAQFGNHTESWVIPVERGGAFVDAVRQALAGVERLVFQNASFDLQVFDRCIGVPMESLWPKVTDTKILAHLVDPRGFKEGGTGHSLEELTRVYIDAEIADSVKTLMKDLAASTKGASTTTIWKKVDLDNPHYELYSGMDPILAARLASKLNPLVPVTARPLIRYEHQLAEVCSMMERTGFLLDVEYTTKLAETLRVDESVANEKALMFGCDMVNSTDRVADVIEQLGGKVTGRTPSGKRQVTDDVLSEFAKTLNPLGEFAQAVIDAKKAGKWRKTWVQKFLDLRDGGDRCHASINPLQARTARMSITGIPAQTLPAGDSLIRNCFVADPGQRIVSVDYQAQELRVLAALSGDKTMIQAFKNDEDLHLLTARAAFGPHISKDDPERKYAKVVNFGRVYGGGAKTVAEQTGLDLARAQQVVAGFDRAYPGVAVLSKKLQREAISNGYITTGVGRRLPVDESRAYSALNYLIQSSSRDVTGRALIRLHKSGFTPYLRLPIHDEVLASVPADKAVWGASEIARIMAEDMGPVHIGTDSDVGGRSWGSLY